MIHFFRHLVLDKHHTFEVERRNVLENSLIGFFHDKKCNTQRDKDTTTTIERDVPLSLEIHLNGERMIEAATSLSAVHYSVSLANDIVFFQRNGRRERRTEEVRRRIEINGAANVVE